MNALYLGGIYVDDTQHFSSCGGECLYVCPCFLFDSSEAWFMVGF